MGVVCSLAMVIGLWQAYRVALMQQQQKEAKLRAAVVTMLVLLPLFLYLPWQPSSYHIRSFVAITLLWTAPCKLFLVWCNSPLDPSSWLLSSFPHFLLAILLPVRISANPPTPPFLYASVKLPLLLIILNVYPSFAHIPTPLLYFLYCVHFYLGLELFLDSLAFLISACFSVHTYPQFDRPFISSSLSEFWGRRWNIMVNSVLRATVYRPLLKLLSGMVFTSHFANPNASSKEKLPRAPFWARAVSMLATFVVSGVLYELIFVYVSKSEPTGEMTAFFLVHGFATILESALAKGNVQVPRAISRLFTLVFLYITVSVFFLRPLRRSGTDLQAIAEYHRLQTTILSPFRKSTHYVH